MQHSYNCQLCSRISRRKFLRFLLPGTISLAILTATPPAHAQRNAKALVLSCIDFEILEAEHYFLSLQNLSNHYDLVTLAGASLALSGLPHQADAEAFWDQLDYAYRLHHIQKVILLDHQNCFAYADKIDPNISQNLEQEVQIHTQYLSRAYWAIRDRYPDLNIELYFVMLNADVKSVTPQAKA
jgi:hypothetical protein